MAKLQNYKCKKTAERNSPSSEITGGGSTLFFLSVAKTSTALVVSFFTVLSRGILIKHGRKLHRHLALDPIIVDF